MMNMMKTMTKNYTYDSDHTLLAVESRFYKVKFDRSKGEKMISKWLKKNKIHFKSEYSFDFSAKSFLSTSPDDNSFSKIECLDIKSSMPPLPNELYEKFTKKYSLSQYDALIIIEQKEIAFYYEKILTIIIQN